MPTNEGSRITPKLRRLAPHENSARPAAPEAHAPAATAATETPVATAATVTREPVTAWGLCVSGWNLSKIRGCVYFPPITHNLVKRQMRERIERLCTHTP